MVEQGKIFVLSPAELQRIEREINDDVDRGVLNYINRNDLVDPNIPEEIKCEVCEGFPHKAIQGECEHLFCTYCFSYTLNSPIMCPVATCNQTFKLAVKIPKVT